MAAAHITAESDRPVTAGVVVVTHDTCDEVLGCLASLDTDHLDAVVVVDSGSVDGTADAVRVVMPGVKVVELDNVGFGRAANAGIRACGTEVTVVCNADVRFDPGAITEMVRLMAADRQIGAAGPLVTYPDGSVQASARCEPDLRTAFVHALLGRIAPDNAATRRYHACDVPTDQQRDVDWLSGCAVALRRDAVDAVGGFDPGYFLYVEDVDLSQRLRAAGWRLRFDPDAHVTHRVGASTSRRRFKSLYEHACSLDRFVRQRQRPVTAALTLLPRRVALAAWVCLTYALERTLKGRSTTGERRSEGRR